MISLMRKWMHHRAANRGWNEIYEHMEKQIDSETSTQPDPHDPDNPDVTDTRDTTDSTCAMSPVSQEDCSAPPDTCSEDDDDSNYTSISYRHLTIKIQGKITIGKNLISLCIYEV